MLVVLLLTSDTFEVVLQLFLQFVGSALKDKKDRGQGHVTRSRVTKVTGSSMVFGVFKN